MPDAVLSSGYPLMAPSPRRTEVPDFLAEGRRSANPALFHGQKRDTKPRLFGLLGQCPTVPCDNVVVLQVKTETAEIDRLQGVQEEVKGEIKKLKETIAGMNNDLQEYKGLRSRQGWAGHGRTGLEQVCAGIAEQRTVGQGRTGQGVAGRGTGHKGTRSRDDQVNNFSTVGIFSYRCHHHSSHAAACRSPPQLPVTNIYSSNHHFSLAIQK